MTARALTPGRLAAAALALHAALVGAGVLHDSVTNDELGHLPAGIAYLQRGAFAVNPQPPLVKVLGAAASLAAGAHTDYLHAWLDARGRDSAVHYPKLARDFMRANADPPGHYHRIYMAARLVVLPFSLLLGIVLFLWGRELFGAWGGWLACTLWCFSPDAIGHAALFTSDIPAAATMLAATWVFWRWLRAPRMAGAIGCGVLLGLAQLVKLSALCLYGLWPLMALPSLFGARRLAAPRAVVPGAAALVATSLLVLNAGYGFQGTGHRLGDPDYLSTAFTRPRPKLLEIDTPHVYRAVYAMRVNRFRDTTLGRLPVPLPRAFLAAIDLQGFEAHPGIPGAGFYASMRGEVRLGSWPLYFPYALWVKSTPAFVLLLLAAPFLMAFAPRARLAARDEVFLWAPPATLLAMGSVSGLDLGVRYMLPAVAFLMLAASRAAALLPSRAAAAAVGSAALVQVASALAIGP
ncbi:MAG TPA: glycosyltransferase family 39 protein, partial [Myxococcota bacterium]|nr:glycosyltransferase family 39 protein [Myxococcota bacterium]